MEFYVDENQKRKNRRILKIKIYGGLTVFLILSAAIFYAVVYSPIFQIAQINIYDGTSDVPIRTSDVLILTDDLKIYFANQSKLTGFLGAENILIWNNKIEDFLKQNSQFVGLSIKRNFLKREVKINFQKRERFGVWCQSECVWFDKRGVAFEKAPKIEGEMIFRVEDFSEKELMIGDKIMEESLFANLLKIFSILEQSDVGIRTLVIKNLSLQEAAVESENPSIPKIYFSLRFDPAFTMAAINSLKEYGLNKIQYIDFRVENRAYYKTK